MKIGDMTNEQFKSFLEGLVGKELPISGGKGISMEDALVIDVASEGMNMDIEGMIVRALFPGHRQTGQALMGDDNGHKFDRITVTGPGGDKAIYFDITSSFGHFSNGPVFKDGKLISY
jgi:hypothetical protein